MSYVIALVLAFISFAVSIHHLHQGFSNYFDFVGLLVVCVGTLSVGVVLFPWRQMDSFQQLIKSSFGPLETKSKILVQDGYQLVVMSQSQTTFQFKTQAMGLPGQLLMDGAELLQLGLSKESIENILVQRTLHSLERMRQFVNIFRSLSKYPPAFGLVGTVLGLVSLMRAISEGAGSSETGLRMSVALVATLYGLLLANLIVNPFSEFINKRIQEIENLSEIAIQAVMLASDTSRSTVESRELLNSYVDASSRLSWKEDAA